MRTTVMLGYTLFVSASRIVRSSVFAAKYLRGVKQVVEIKNEDLTITFKF